MSPFTFEVNGFFQKYSFIFQCYKSKLIENEHIFKLRIYMVLLHKESTKNILCACHLIYSHFIMYIMPQNEILKKYKML